MNNSALKEYFHQSYQGYESFLDKVIFPIFGKEKFENGYELPMLYNNPELQTAAQAMGVVEIIRVGTIALGFDSDIELFDIKVNNHVQLTRNRVGVQQLIRRVMDTYSSAFMIFHYDDDEAWDWRFSFCKKGDGKSNMTDGKRFTFLLGPGQSCRTVADNFSKLSALRGDIEVKDIEEAFDVEALSREFFEKYKQHYERFVEYITGKRFVKEKGKWEERTTCKPHAQMYEDFGRDDKRVRDYVKKMMGRIVFLHFLQKKGWMGVPQDKNWGEGDSQFMFHLFECATPLQQDNFLDSVLEPLFSDALDTCREGDLYDMKVAFKGGSVVKVPYLNGGLFERDELDQIPTQFPREFFKDLFVFFDQYNFTIDENDPNDAQVGVDPEMLGRIFENLLEDNKDKGAFYTPKEIVRYMCRQSLVAYLQAALPDEAEQQAVAAFVESYDIALLTTQANGKSFSADFIERVDVLLRNVKICDPAIGSGAFPMGMLREVFLCRGAIENFDNAAEIKRHIIEQNIYGVDIERGAVDIARLRFWLSLIVDEETPHALPNMDFKVMQGNSLLEEYEGVNLSGVTINEQRRMTARKKKVEAWIPTLGFDEDGELDNIQHAIKEYYRTDHRTAKVQLRKLIDETIKTYILNMKGCTTDIQEKLKALPIPNSQFFLWHIYFKDVFDQGGFDIVIGNPPYVQLQNNGGELAALYAKSGFETFARTGDIYCLFYEQGYRLLKEGGHLCFITSNKWMRAGYGEKTRAFLAANTDPQILIDFAGLKIFESATVDTNILLFAKGENKHHTLSATIKKAEKSCLNNLSAYLQQMGSICDFSVADSWVILSPIEQSIKRKIEAVGKPLKDWDIQINYGIKTGYNDAFIISSETREEILANCQNEEERERTAELIRPILRGRDIKRYGYDWAGLWLINTHNGIKGKIDRIHVEDYPAVKAYLDQFWDKISKRADKGDTPYNLRNCAYMEDFNKPKIVYPNMTKYMPFVYDENAYCTNQKCFIVTGQSMAYLTAFFNSSLFKFCFRESFPELQGGTREMSKIFFDKIPVSQVTTEMNAKFKSSVDDIQREYTKSKAIAIDTMIFDLYNLSERERQVIGFVEIE